MEEALDLSLDRILNDDDSYVNTRTVESKIKLNLNRPREKPLGVQEIWLSEFIDSAYERGKFVSPTLRPPLSQGDIVGSHFC